MKRFILTIISLIAVMPFMAKTTLPSQLQKFAEACSLENTGLSDHDKYAMMSAIDIFNKIEREPLTDYTVKEGNPVEPTLRYNESYCEALLKNNFTLVALDDLRLMRGLDTILTLDVAVEGNSSLSLSIPGNGRCAVLVAGMPYADINALIADGNKFMDLESAGYLGITALIWERPSDAESDFTLIVTNNSESTQSIVVAAY